MMEMVLLMMCNYLKIIGERRLCWKNLILAHRSFWMRWVWYRHKSLVSNLKLWFCQHLPTNCTFSKQNSNVKSPSRLAYCPLPTLEAHRVMWQDYHPGNLERKERSTPLIIYFECAKLKSMAKSIQPVNLCYATSFDTWYIWYQIYTKMFNLTPSKSWDLITFPRHDHELHEQTQNRVDPIMKYSSWPFLPWDHDIVFHKGWRNTQDL